MKLLIAGGVGEHGRNCFIVEGEKSALILDCGLMAGAGEPYPRLTDEQIQKAKWLFLSHSHADHSGAYTWLLKHGFNGQAVITEETSRQLSSSVRNGIFIDRLVPPGAACALGAGLSVVWGRSGHCAGSAWFKIGFEGKVLLYSGDYIEDTLAYACDPIRGQEADLAILDCAYGDAVETPHANREALCKTLYSLLSNKNFILLPVPKYGRALELMLLLRRRFPEIPQYPDGHLSKELTRLNARAPWLKPEILQELQVCAQSPEALQRGFILISDPQLKSPSAQETVKKYLAENGAVVITGSCDDGSFSETLLSSGRAVFARYSVHMRRTDAEKLSTENRFAALIQFHSRECCSPQAISF